VATLNDIQKKLEDLQKQFERAKDEGLNVVNPFKGSNAQQVIDNLGSIEDAISAIEREFKNVNAEILESTSGLKSLSERFVDISKELGSFQGGLKSANKSYNKLVGLSDQLADAQFDLTKTNTKSLKSLQFKADLEFKRLRQQKEFLEKQIENKKLSDREKERAEELLQFAIDSEKSLKDKIGYQDDFNSAIEETIKRQKRINKATGLTGKILGGFGNILQKAGFGDMAEDIQLAKDKMSALAVELTNNGEKSAGFVGQFKIMGEGLGSLFKSIGSSLSDPLVVLGLLVKAAKSLYESLTFAKNESLAVAKATSGMLSKGFMQNLTNASNGMTLMFEDSLKATDELRKNLGFIPSQIGRSAKEGKALVNEIHTLTEAFGLSGQEASNVYSILQSSDIPVKNIYKELDKAAVEFERSSGYAVDTQAAMKVLSSSSAIVRNNMRGNAQELIKSANNAALMRMSLDDIRNAAESTLDFQGSIRKEMEAEMFLQKDLNLDAYRFAAATGDTAGQTKELQRLIRQNYKGLKNNTFAQQSFADALGISREQLAESIDSIELQNKLGAVTNDQVKYYNQLLKKGYSEEEAKAQIQKMGAEGVRKAFEEQQNQANRIARIQERFKQAIAGIAESLEPIIGKISDFFSSPAGKTFAKIAGLVAGGALVITAGKSLVNLFTGGLFKRGNNPTKPLFAHVVNQGTGTTTDVGKIFFKGNLFKYLGKDGGLSRTLNRTLIKVFGRNGFTKFMQTKVFNPSTLKKTADGYKVVNRGTTMLGRGLNKLFGKIIPQSGTNLQKAFGTNNMAKIQKMAETGRYAKGTVIDGVKMGGKIMPKTQQAKAASTASRFIRTSQPLAKTTSLFSKLGPTLTKTLKVLGPVGVAADAIFGGIKGFKQSQMSAEEQKSAGIKEGIGKTEATVQGVLTGGAEKGSMFTSMLGGKKGSAGDEALGIGMAAGRGALVGAAVGSVVPVVGTAVGGAVGAVVGTVAEGFKVFSDPNSSLRKGIVDFASSTREKISNWATSTKETIGGWASTSKEKISGWASSAGKTISKWLETVKNKFTAIRDKVVNAVTGIPGRITNSIKKVGGKVAKWLGFATGGIAQGGFQAFASGGIVSKPTLGLVGEGRMNEAIIPLPDGQSVPVRMHGGDNNNEVVSLLKELIGIVKQGGDIIIDGKKIGETIAMTTSRMG